MTNIKYFYIRGLLPAYQPKVALRSLGQNKLVEPTTTNRNRTVLTSRAFQNYAP